MCSMYLFIYVFIYWRIYTGLKDQTVLRGIVAPCHQHIKRCHNSTHLINLYLFCSICPSALVSCLHIYVQFARSVAVSILSTVLSILSLTIEFLILFAKDRYYSYSLICSIRPFNCSIYLFTHGIMYPILTVVSNLAIVVYISSAVVSITVSLSLVSLLLLSLML